MTTRDLPLTALLSQALVAFTIELDDAVERRLPHRTTDHRATSSSRGAPWLVSLAMWFNCMRFVDEAGVTVAELEALARTPTNLDGMRRWGYLTIDGAGRATKVRRPGSGARLRATPTGLRAREVWRPLLGETEERWTERLGADAVQRLRDALWALAGRFAVALPDCLPILGHGLANRRRLAGDAGQPAATPAERGEDPDGLSLAALLARVLLACALDFERRCEPALAIVANPLRVLDADGVRVADLPRRTGVSKEAVAMALGVLEKRGLAVTGADPAGSRSRVSRLTPASSDARTEGDRALAAVETGLATRFGDDAPAELRAILEPLVAGGASSPLMGGLVPAPGNWRAALPRPQTLRHFPMVLHRGGFPDGS